MKEEGGIDALLRRAGSPYPLTSLQAAMAGASGVGLLVGIVAFKGPAAIRSYTAAVRSAHTRGLRVAPTWSRAATARILGYGERHV